MIDTGSSDAVWAVAFHHCSDGTYVLGTSSDGVRRWRLADGQGAGKQTGVTIRSISVSKDNKWIVCGTMRGASVWDADVLEKVVEVEGTNAVAAVDMAPDSTRFATGIADSDATASIWSVVTGQRLVGPLQHDDDVIDIKFSPNGQHIATACYRGSIRVFDTTNSDLLVNIMTTIPSRVPNTPIAWSNDGERIFAVCDNNQAKSFHVATGSTLAESQVLDGGNVWSIAIGTHGKFIATFAGHSISFLDTSSLAQIGPVIQDSGRPRSISLSPDGRYLAIGQFEGKIIVRNLGGILPDLYGPFQVSMFSLHSVGTSDNLNIPSCVDEC